MAQYMRLLACDPPDFASIDVPIVLPLSTLGYKRGPEKDMQPFNVAAARMKALVLQCQVEAASQLDLGGYITLHQDVQVFPEDSDAQISDNSHSTPPEFYDIQWPEVVEGNERHCFNKWEEAVTMYNDAYIGTYMDRVITTVEVPQETVLAQGSEVTDVDTPIVQLQEDEETVEVPQNRSFEIADYSHKEELNSEQEQRGTGDHNDRSTSQRLTAQLRVGGAPTLAKNLSSLVALFKGPRLRQSSHHIKIRLLC